MCVSALPADEFDVSLPASLSDHVEPRSGAALTLLVVSLFVAELAVAADRQIGSDEQRRPLRIARRDDVRDDSDERRSATDDERPRCAGCDSIESSEHGTTHAADCSTGNVSCRSTPACAASASLRAQRQLRA